MTRTFEPSIERLSELFVTLARIPSPSLSERGVADTIVSMLAGLGIHPTEDLTGQAIGGDCGNLVCTVGGERGKPCIALGAHMDTVPPAGDIEPVLEGGEHFTNANDGILGADDKAAIAALLHATELLVQSGADFPPFELFFTVCEENGLVGAKHLEAGALRSPIGAVLDSTGPVGGVVAAAPSQKIIKAQFKGTAAHAGLEPELGRSAVQAAAKAIAEMHLGRLDAETTANIGVINGGTATNVVPDYCEVAGECRGHDETRLADVAAHMVDALQLGAAETGVDVDIQLVDEFRAFRLEEKLPVVALAKRAISALGVQPSLQTAGGGSDANVLNAKGIPTVNLTAGMMRVHSAGEYIELEELKRLCELALQLVTLSGDEGPDGPSPGDTR